MNEQFVSSAIENAISFCLLIEYMIEEILLRVASLPNKANFFNAPTVTTTAINDLEMKDITTFMEAQYDPNHFAI